MDRLFSDKQRTSYERHLETERLMDYLERSADPIMEVARHKIQQLYDRYLAECPHEDINWLNKMLYSKLENQFFEIYFELFMFDYLKSNDLDISIAPKYVKSGKNNMKPDFGLSGNDGSIIYLEATVMREKTEPFGLDSEKLKYWLKNQFERILNKGFHLQIRCDEREPYYPRVIEVYQTQDHLYRAARNWHDGLDYESIRRDIDDRDCFAFEDCPTFVGYLGEDPFESIKVIIQAIPMALHVFNKNAGHKIQADTGFVGVKHDNKKFISVCRTKLSKYSESALFLAILLPMKSRLSDFRAIIADLYGQDRIAGSHSDEIDLRVSECMTESLFIGKHGSYRFPNAKGILVFYDVIPWSPGSETCELYLHPTIEPDFTPVIPADRTFRRFGELMKFDRDRTVT